ncbi:hypothetical protein TA3x_004119 [Tundrisphaera sp. TA3]|uniref:hypothetical protein n=1 Tax=Tundrisphaera sp. TA3 TaxID=3435775 RepID=UPI003EBBCEC8
MTQTVLERSGKPAAKARRVRIDVTIDRNTYELARLDCDASIGRKAFRLTKRDGVAYDVAETVHGPTCDCPDFIFRRDGLDPDGCKHIRALVDSGLIDEA